MSGARRDIAGRFRTIDDIRALLTRGDTAEPPAAHVSLLVKSSDDHDWRPLADE